MTLFSLDQKVGQAVFNGGSAATQSREFMAFHVDLDETDLAQLQGVKRQKRYGDSLNRDLLECVLCLNGSHSGDRLAQGNAQYRCSFAVRDSRFDQLDVF